MADVAIIQGIYIKTQTLTLVSHVNSITLPNHENSNCDENQL